MAQSLSHPEQSTAHPKDAPGHGHTQHHHVPGSMDISTHERTFAAFMRFVSRTVIVILVALVLLALING